MYINIYVNINVCVRRVICLYTYNNIPCIYAYVGNDNNTTSTSKKVSHSALCGACTWLPRARARPCACEPPTRRLPHRAGGVAVRGRRYLPVTELTYTAAKKHSSAHAPPQRNVPLRRYDTIYRSSALAEAHVSTSTTTTTTIRTGRTSEPGYRDFTVRRHVLAGLCRRLPSDDGQPRTADRHGVRPLAAAAGESNRQG